MTDAPPRRPIYLGFEQGQHAGIARRLQRLLLLQRRRRQLRGAGSAVLQLLLQALQDAQLRVRRVQLLLRVCQPLAQVLVGTLRPGDKGTAALGTHAACN